MSYRFAVGVGAAGLVASGVGWGLAPDRFFGGWLAAVTLFSAWPLGSIALLLTHALTGGRWGEVLRPALRAGVCALPLLMPAMLPLLPGVPSLFFWAHPHAVTGNQFYLNLPFFAVRGAIYLVVWLAEGWLVLDGRFVARLAPAGLFLLALTTTFAAIDATMSLDPHFTSSIYGMIAAAQMGLVALAMAVLQTAAATPSHTTSDDRADLGKLLLALVILGVYLDFMQLLIIWQSDLSADALWYRQRFRSIWGALSVVMLLGQFVLPFFLLLSPRTQRSGPVIIGVAALLVAMGILRSWWTVLPSLGQGIDWIDLACMVGLCGLAIVTAQWFSRWAEQWAQARG